MSCLLLPCHRYSFCCCCPLQFYPRAQWPTPAKVRGLGAWGGVVVAAGIFVIQVSNCQQYGKAFSMHSGLCCQHRLLSKCCMHLASEDTVTGALKGLSGFARRMPV
jgi:hypothetical protein